MATGVRIVNMYRYRTCILISSIVWLIAAPEIIRYRLLLVIYLFLVLTFHQSILVVCNPADRVARKHVFGLCTTGPLEPRKPENTGIWARLDSLAS